MILIPMMMACAIRIAALCSQRRGKDDCTLALCLCVVLQVLRILVGELAQDFASCV